MDRVVKSPLLRARLLASFAALIGCLSVGWVAATPASADFHIVSLGAGTYNQDGSSAAEASSHPYAARVSFTLSSEGFFKPSEPFRSVRVDLPRGFVPNPTSTPALCTPEQMASAGTDAGLLCPIDSQVGIARLWIPNGVDSSFTSGYVPLYNMVPVEGTPATIGFTILGIFVNLIPEVRSGSDYGVSVDVDAVNQILPLVGSTIELWGVPADPSHDEQRHCPGTGSNGVEGNGGVFGCSSSGVARPFLTNPSQCVDMLPTTFTFNTYFQPNAMVSGTVDEDENGNPALMDGCADVPFDPEMSVSPSADTAETPSGLEVQLDVPSSGLLNPDGSGQSHVKKVVTALPEGVTVNPSSGEGLSTCTPAQYQAETATSSPGAGCPNGSRIGSVEIETPLLRESVDGALYLAQQDDPATAAPGAENPFDSLLALYIVAKLPERGVVVKVAGKIEPDPKTGQLVTTFDNLPQLPFSTFRLRFREGGRAPLVTPRACGTYTTTTDFVPWSAADPDNPTADEIVTTTSQFQITRGVGGGPCPAGGLPPFKPGIVAGTINNAAGRFSPFNIRLTRNDGEQEFTRFSIKLPPGITAKLAGTPFCPDAAIEAAKSKTGAAELASPSCPKASEVGRTLVGAGVGSVLTYVPGKIYLAGPYNGSALSIAAITAAKVGPFDVGTVVIREALKVDPETAEVFIDATGSDPIPHIIEGIPVHARDIRAYVDKPQFVLNPTSCDRTSTASTLLGAGLDFASDIDNNPITVTSPFQAADCAALPFKPKLSLRLIGGTKRGDHPKFRAHLKMNGIGEAAIERAQVTLPKSEFLENANIRTICTRVQFNKGPFPGAQCPQASVYGYAKAITPILDEPIEGPVFLRSSEHELPDLVAALHSGKINVNLIGRIDSVKGGGLRNTFEAVPDAPVSTFTLTMQGGKKGLLVNSTNLCKGTHKAKVAFDAHNGKFSDSRIPLKAKCKGKGKKRNRAR